MADAPTLTLVYAQVQIEGIHFWQDAPMDVYYLRSPHRHIFHIKAAVQVNHDNREVEFIMLGHAIEAWLKISFGKTRKDGALDLGQMSCEQLAQNLLDDFGLYSCEVSEDGENGAIITRA